MKLACGRRYILKSKGKVSIFGILNITILIIVMLITLYPFMYIVFASFSEPTKFIQHSGILLKPLGFSIKAYQKVFEDPRILLGYKNTLVILIVGTTLNVFTTAILAYVLASLSKRKAKFYRIFMMLIVFTMFFKGGIIPSFLVVRQLGLLDSLWALMIPLLINTYNLIIMRTFFMGIPVSLEEAARIDGASETKVLFKIILPLSMPVMAVMVLFYGVHHWNSWFQARIYLTKRELFPLQLILREILIESNTDEMMGELYSGEEMALSEVIKYATIIIATLPILILYPFLQKYFVKGVMVGAVKG